MNLQIHKVFHTYFKKMDSCTLRCSRWALVHIALLLLAHYNDENGKSEENNLKKNEDFVRKQIAWILKQ